MTALPCPLCSYAAISDPLAPARQWVLAAPVWALAHRTSAKRGLRCAMLIGCGHVTRFTRFAIVEAPQAAAAVAAWNAEAERLLVAQSAQWPAAQIAAIRATLGFPDVLAPTAPSLP